MRAMSTARLIVIAFLCIAGCDKKPADTGASTPARLEPAAPTPASTDQQPSLEVEVTAQNWLWTFEYPDGLRSSELHLPAHSVVRLRLRSRDDEHVFAAEPLGVTQTIPAGGEVVVDVAVGAAVRGEVHNPALDARDGAPEGGAESMRAALVVADAAAHAAWIRELSAGPRAGGRTPVQWGEDLFQQQGCRSCHSVDGSTGVGPSLAGVWARTTAGTTPMADGRSVGELIGPGRAFASPSDYLKAQILDPASVVEVRGFDPVAPAFGGVLDDAEVAALLAYLRTL